MQRVWHYILFRRRQCFGGIKTQGFLPWDDDADLYITRNNYNKMREVQDKFFSEDFVLVNNENYPHYGNSLVRCVDTHSTAITKARIADGTPKGQFIELFILDPIPTDKDEQIIWLKKHWIYTELLSFTYRVANVRIADYTDELLYEEYKKMAEEKGKEEVLKLLEKELFSIDEKDAKEFCSRWGLRNLIYDIAWFQEPRYVPFEDAQLPVATFAENVLRFDYGDSWMYIPNVDEQIVHTFSESMTIGYQHFEDDYLQFFDINTVFNAYEKRKEYLMKAYFNDVRMHKIKVELKKAYVIASLEYRLLEGINLEDWVNHRKYDSIESFFTVWYENQFQKLFWAWGTLLDIKDELLYPALLPLFVKGEYSKVRKLLIMRSKKVN